MTIAEGDITYIEQPDARPLKRGGYHLNEEYVYQWAYSGRVSRITVPRGFRWDGASVPRAVWTLSGLQQDGLIRAAALIHDWIYHHDGKLPLGSQQEFEPGVGWIDIIGTWTRQDADKLFARMMRDSGIEPRYVRRAYVAVRAFGWILW